jgi:adenylylsulfate kinase
VGGATIWITGLSGAGKTTLAGLVADELRRCGHRVEVLDGDDVRPHLFKGIPRSKAERNEVVRRLGFVCNLLSAHGVYAIAAAVAPYREVRDEARAGANGRFFEVYLATPLDDCARRDVRGLYAKAAAGEIEHFPGIDVPYEPPLDPELTLWTNIEPPEISARTVLIALEHCGFHGCAPARSSVR